ncbi:MAG: c-type cytochrome [Acidobacteria bacterium]|nr:c-type cytochrome [Acidobacteriota bacterium]
MRSSRAASVAALFFLIAAVEGGFLAVARLRDTSRARGASAALRGRDVADRLGCFGCHGPEGVRGIANPGSRDGDVPPWVGGTYAMYNESPSEIREWIVNGAPKRLVDHPDHDRSTTQLLSMPAYGKVAAAQDLDDLVAYVQTVSGAFPPPDGAAAAGRTVAVENGCFGCHGPEGRGLVRNPGSLKGYIPAWDSSDYAELVRSPDEFREWVREGEIKRFRNNPAAAHFLDEQVLKMPAYRGILSDDECEKIRAYVEWVRGRKPEATQ